MSNFPAGWIEVTLEGVANVIRGITFPSSSKRPNEAVGFTCCLRTSNVQREVDWNDVYFVPDEYVKRDDQFLAVGDILMSMANSYELVGKVARVNKLPIRAAFGAFISAIRPTHISDGRYLFHLLRTADVQAALRAGSSQTTNIANISVGRLNTINVTLAPLAEQQRIADKLDTVLARVDACRDRLARVAPLLKRFRQSVLAAATSGVLTDDWRSNERAWSESLLGDVLVDKPRNGYSPKAVGFPTPVLSLTLSATTSGQFKAEHSKYIDEEISSESHLWLEPGDVLIQRSNSLEYVGISAIFDGERRRFIYPDLMMKARANKLRISPQFLHITLSADRSRRYFRENATGTAGNMPKINQQVVMSLPISFPTIEEQTEIVRRVETLFAYADRLEARLAKAQTAVDRLTPALLAKAFRGELVPQHPDDEPAAELLKRLAAQRAASPAKPRRRRARA